MILDIQVSLDYKLDSATDILLQVEAAGGDGQSILTADLELSETEHFARIDAEDGIGERIWIRASDGLTCDYRARVQIERPVTDIGRLAQVPMHLLPAETVKYLMPSRYCPADEFRSFVSAEFGEFSGGARIAAMRDWIGSRFQYVPGASNAGTTALDTFVQRQGICRDYAHVLITLARASAVPARMASVFGLGVTPQDFHAVAEVYLDNCWHPVDATDMASADQMARIGVGRDAADIAFVTSYGRLDLQNQSVRVKPV